MVKLRAFTDAKLSYVKNHSIGKQSLCTALKTRPYVFRVASKQSMELD